MGLCFGTFIGGHYIYTLYKHHLRSRKFKAKRDVLEAEKKKMIDDEIEGYKRRIKELEAEVVKYKRKYQVLKKKGNSDVKKVRFADEETKEEVKEEDDDESMADFFNEIR